MRKISLAEWEAEGTEKFGKDMMKWKFECPACGNVQSPEDFRKFKDRGATPSDAYFNCIGRFVGGGDAFVTKTQPCNYTMGGLIRLAKTIVIDKEGIEHYVFEFASPASSEKGNTNV